MLKHKSETFVPETGGPITHVSARSFWRSATYAVTATPDRVDHDVRRGRSRGAWRRDRLSGRWRRSRRHGRKQPIGNPCERPTVLTPTMWHRSIVYFRGANSDLIHCINRPGDAQLPNYHAAAALDCRRAARPGAGSPSGRQVLPLEPANFNDRVRVRIASIPHLASLVQRSGSGW